MTRTTDRERTVPVAIVGAGPVGLSLALGLARQGVRSVLLERNRETTRHSRAAGVHLRTREAFRQWGVEDRFLAAGTLVRTLHLHDARSGGGALLTADFSRLEEEADRPGILLLEQSRTEALLLEAVRESGMCDLRFGAEAVSLGAGADRVRLGLRAGGREERLDAEYVAGCDGASSFVRSALRLPFEGITYSLRPALADVRIRDSRDDLPWPRVLNRRGGLSFALRLSPGLWRLVHLERGASEGDDDIAVEALAERVAGLLGEGPFEVVWSSRFRIHRRAAPRFRAGRVVLAGDAAHVHSPAGGLGMNAGVQDAHNLAWKLAHALRGGDPERLLDAYDVERRGVVVEDVSRYTEFVTRAFLQAPAPVRQAAFVLARAAFRVPRLRRRSLRRATMIDLDYGGSPLLDGGKPVGRRLPNPELLAPGGDRLRLYDLLPYRSAVLDLFGGAPVAVPADVVRIGAGGYVEPAGLLLRLLGGRPGWIVVRPDAHVGRVCHRPEELKGAVRSVLGRRAAEE